MTGITNRDAAVRWITDRATSYFDQGHLPKDALRMAMNDLLAVMLVEALKEPIREAVQAAIEEKR